MAEFVCVIKIDGAGSILFARAKVKPVSANSYAKNIGDPIETTSASISKMSLSSGARNEVQVAPTPPPTTPAVECTCGMPLCICEAPAPAASPPRPAPEVYSLFVPCMDLIIRSFISSDRAQYSYILVIKMRICVLPDAFTLAIFHSAASETKKGVVLGCYFWWKHLVVWKQHAEVRFVSFFDVHRVLILAKGAVSSTESRLLTILPYLYPSCVCHHAVYFSKVDILRKEKAGLLLSRSRLLERYVFVSLSLPMQFST